MKAMTSAGWGPKTRLLLGERAVPTPGKNDVLVRVHAASVNPKDWKLNRSGAMLATPLLASRLPPLFGDDFAGEILALGAAVQGFELGDRVYGMDMHPRTATLAEQAVIDYRCIAPLPDSLSFEQAAGVPLAALTALQGLRLGKAKAGMSILIIGASGGVGTFAVQIAKAMGCKVTAVCSERNTDLVESLGADALIDYTKGNYRKTSGSFDLVFDVTSYESRSSCASLLGPDAYFINTGGTATAIVSGQLSLNSHSKTVWVKPIGKDLLALNEMFEAGTLRPVIDSKFPLEQAEKAYARSRSGRASGKIIITVA